MNGSDDGEARSHEPDLPEEPETGWPDEPEEFDPGDVGPSVPSAPAPDSPDNPEAVQLFWKLVVVFNVALLALSVGPMFIVFRNRWNVGVQIFSVGVLAFAYGTFRYYRFRDGSDERNG